jgi:hypothetical protein
MRPTPIRFPAPERASFRLRAAERLHGRIVDSYRALERNFKIETDPAHTQIRRIAHFPAAADYVGIADRNRVEAPPLVIFRTRLVIRSGVTLGSDLNLTGWL